MLPPPPPPPARDKFRLPPWLEVYLVLEEDGTEVDEEEYFQVNTAIEISPSSLNDAMLYVYIVFNNLVSHELIRKVP